MLKRNSPKSSQRTIPKLSSKRNSPKSSQRTIILTPKSRKTSSSSRRRKVPACVEYKNLLNDRKDINKKVQEKNTECESELFKEIKKYFYGVKEPSCFDLLVALYSYYKNNNVKRLYFREFINMFEKSTTTDTNFKRQHVFEAICKILLFFNYDKGELGNNKAFFSSLEEKIKKPNLPPLENEIILYSKINEGSSAGVVDIFFISNYTKENLCNDDWSCDCKQSKSRRQKFNKHYNIKSKEKEKIYQQYIMIQNKYYGEEKADIEKYDVSKIYSKADKLSKLDKNIDKKIILMVNNEDSLHSKITRSRNINKNLIDKIYGVKTLEDWFRLLLNDFEKYFDSNDNAHKIIEQFIEQFKNGKKNEIKLNPRFHQKLITNSTEKYYNKEGFRMFIWGAVPRSGKSYMIADMIAKRTENINDIVIILGAKAETECQFIKMFKTFNDFENYGIINNNKKCKGTDEKDKNIYIFSQEFFKMNKIINGNFNDTFKKEYQSLFQKRKIDLYFDEIHKGGTTDRSQNILNTFKNANVEIDIFVMVTATFAKPKIRYNTHFIDKFNKKTKLIEWSYEDQQNMKSIVNQTQKQIMINRREDIEQEVITNIFDEYEKEYGDKYLDIISKEYEKHPELVILQPDIDIDINKMFELKCNACKNKQSINEFMDPNNIFEQVDRLDFLQKNIHSVYEQLFNMDAPIGNTKSDPHSELWFLPDRNLYPSDLNCKDVCKEITSDENYDDEIQTIRGIPNIEPLTRGLSLLLMNKPYFKEKYNIAIVHNSDPKYKIFSNGRNQSLSYDQIFEEKGIKMLTGSDNIGDDIKNFENKTYKENKSLIILTGGKLRLGISLPCVDIAFNFDNIKSIDNNYQTMFRVLTERYNKPKKYGYYVDFNKERTIQFIYEFNKLYGIGKKIPNIKENVDYLKSLLFLFNFNGLGLIKQNTQSELKLYNSLIQKLQLNEEKYVDFYMNNDNIVNLIKKTLFTGNISDNIIKDMKKNFIFEKTKNIKYNLKKGKTKEKEENEDEENEDEENDEEEEENIEENDDEQSITKLAEIIKELTFLFALFSNEYYYDCDDLEKCINNCLRNIDKFSAFCNCKNDLNEIYVCYINNTGGKPYNRSQLKQFLIMFIKLLENDDLKNVLKFIFNSIKTKMSNTSNPLIYDMSENDIMDTIKQYLPIREKEKNENGEVFTPYELINEMLDKLPEEVWYDPDLKWLDPANGIGNFPMVIYGRLMVTLADIDGLKNKKNRHTHIIRNMLYMVELNPRNIEISRRIFGEDANIYCGDFLEGKWEDQFEIEEFDIVVGNPPFNKGGIRSHTGKQLGEKNETIWTKFIEKSFAWLKPDGFLVFINPLSWLKKSHSLHNELLEKHIVWLKLWDNSQSKGMINADIPISLYVLQNKKNTSNKKTEITSILKRRNLTTTSTEYLNKNYSIPLAYHSIFNKLIRFIETNNLQLGYKTKTIKSSGTKAKIPTEYTLEDMWAIDTFTIKEGIMVKKATEQHPDANKRKLIISNKASFTGAFIDEGKLSLTGNHKFYILGDKLEFVKKMLDYRIINIIGHYTKYGQDFLDNEAFKYLPDIRNLGIADITEDEFYKLIGLTNQEINQIKSS